jgi:hypothetical protein
MEGMSIVDGVPCRSSERERPSAEAMHAHWPLALRSTVSGPRLTEGYAKRVQGLLAPTMPQSAVGPRQLHATALSVRKWSSKCTSV